MMYYDSNYESNKSYMQPVASNEPEPLRALSPKLKERIVKVLFGYNVPQSSKEQLFRLFEKKYNVNHCLVLRADSNDFEALCKKLGLSPGMKQVTVSKNSDVIQYTDDYHKAPYKIDA